MAVKTVSTNPSPYFWENGRVRFQSRVTTTLDKMARQPASVKKVGFFTDQGLEVVECYTRANSGLPRALRLIRLIKRLKRGV